jgi:hypothetical protein
MRIGMILGPDVCKRIPMDMKHRTIILFILIAIVLMGVMAYIGYATKAIPWDLGKQKTDDGGGFLKKEPDDHEEEFFYYSSKQKIPLGLSTDVIAIRFKKETPIKRRVEVIESIEYLKPFQDRVELTEDNIILVGVKKTISKKKLLEFIDNLSTFQEIEFATPVFLLKENSAARRSRNSVYVFSME